MDNYYSFCFAVLDAGELTDLAIIYYISCIRAIGPKSAENFHKGGFAGTVFAYQSMDTALFDNEINVIKRSGCHELFSNTPHFEYIF